VPAHARVRRLADLPDEELTERRSLLQVEAIYREAGISKDPSTYRRWCKKNEWPRVVPMPVIKIDMSEGGSPLWLVHVRAIEERAFELARRRDLEIDLNAGGALTPVDAQAAFEASPHGLTKSPSGIEGIGARSPSQAAALPGHAQVHTGEPGHEPAHSSGDAIMEPYEARIADLKDALERERRDKARWEQQADKWQEQSEAINRQLTNAQSNLELAMLRESRGDEVNSGWQKLLTIFGLQKNGGNDGGVLVPRDASQLVDSKLPDIESGRRVE